MKKPKIIEIPEKARDDFDKKGDRIFAQIEEKHNQIRQLSYDIAALVAEYVDMVTEERAKRKGRVQ